MSDFLLTGAVTNAVNMPTVSAEDAPKLKPYMQLATNLGSYLGQLQDENVTSISIEYEGAVSALNTKPLTACVLAGFLGAQLESVNSVSAPAVARERGIAVIANRPFREGALIRAVQRERLPAWAAEAGCANWPEFLLKFVVSHPAVTCAIPATSRADHVRENMGAARGPMPDTAQRARMAAAVAAL
jgi:hypothetical protein